jgi:hypothetical protein
MSVEKKPNSLVAVIQVAIFIAVIWYFFGGGMDKQVANDLQDIHNKVASDAVDQYRIAKRNGSNIDACVQAGMVSAAYLQAKNEAEYQSWKSIENNDCRKAGVPR